MNDDHSISPVYLGVFLIILGLVANKWVLEIILSPDGNIESSIALLLIAVTQLTLIGTGILLVAKRPDIHRPSRKEFLLVIASVLSCVLIAEMFLRVWLKKFSTPEHVARYSLYVDVPSINNQWSPHQYLNYYPTPNYRKGLTSHNSLGYRGPEIELHKPQDSYRIVTLGGSTTYTIAVEDNAKTFPRQMERILREDYNHSNVEVINAGVGGYNSWESLINLQFRVLDLEPDLIIVYHGTNDVHTRLVLPAAYKGDNSGRRKQWSRSEIPLMERSLLIRILLRRWGLTTQVGLGDFVNPPTFFGAGSREWPVGNGMAMATLEENRPIYFRRNLLNMLSTARSNGAEVIFATWAHSVNFNDYASNDVYEKGFRENNQVIAEVADQHGVYLFDFSSVMPADIKYWSDGRHVNEEGALLKAQLFAEYIDRTGVVQRIDSSSDIGF